MSERFQSQASEFDRRAGLPLEACRAVARVIDKLAEDAAEGILLELGTGTGQIGQFLYQLRFPYVGIDSSGEMLEQFRARVPSPSKVKLFEADANHKWPVADKSTAIVFGSRVMHLLDTDHLITEFSRVSNDGLLLEGRVRRDPDSMKSKMRQEMQRLLTECGVQPRSGENEKQEWLSRCCAAGWVPVQPIEAARWRSEHAPIHSIESWESKPGLAGIVVDDQVKKLVLERLSAWAKQRFGEIQRPFQEWETYVITGVKAIRS
jgi:ubiquinone/menaquinone biosynthesis C-methylase UbiE